MTTTSRNDLALVARTGNRLLQQGLIQPGEVEAIEVRHDDWCPLLAGELRCTCSPELWLRGRRVD